MAVVRERGRQIMEVSDAEGNKAMEATLTMLTDRLSNLQALADHKGKQLQVIHSPGSRLVSAERFPGRSSKFTFNTTHTSRV